MIILGIDTCERACSAALWQEGKTLAVRQEEIGRGHAERLLPMLDELYDQAGITADQVDRIGVTVGPGTFTGLRIGLSVARGLAFALKIPCIGISALECLANQTKPAHTIHTVIAGRGEHCYFQSFARPTIAETPNPVSEASNIPLDEAIRHMSENPGPIIGSGIGQLNSPILTKLETHMAFCDPAIVAAVAALKNPSENPPEPLYLRPPDAAKAKPVFKAAPKGQA